MKHPRLFDLTRRTFGKLSIFASLTSVVACQAESLLPEKFVGLVDDITSVPFDFEYPEGCPAFVVKLDISARNGVGQNSRIVAFHRACAHQGCPILDVDVTNGHFGPCGCHQSFFDLTNCGIQVSGRASTRLAQVELAIRENEVWAVGLHGVPYGATFSVSQGLVRSEIVP